MKSRNKHTPAKAKFIKQLELSGHRSWKSANTRRKLLKHKPVVTFDEAMELDRLIHLATLYAATKGMSLGVMDLVDAELDLHPGMSKQRRYQLRATLTCRCNICGKKLTSGDTTRKCRFHADQDLATHRRQRAAKQS